jgi:hypothetical protein
LLTFFCSCTVIANSIIDQANVGGAIANQTDPIIDPQDESSFFYQAGVYAPDKSIGFLMRRVLSSILQLADAQLAEQGLTYVQWLPLYKLLICSDTNSSTLAKDLGMDPASVTRALDRIEAKGCCVASAPPPTGAWCIWCSPRRGAASPPRCPRC